MAGKKSPQLKKQDSYDKDHRTQMENPHAFRKNLPKNNALANRRDRVALRSAMASDAVEELTLKAVSKLQEKPAIRKSFVSTLRVSIQTKKKNRLQRLLAKAEARTRTPS